MHTQRLKKPTELLVVEDNPGDVRLLREAFKDTGFLANLQTAEDGVLAMEFLRRHGMYEEAPRPDLILLDLNLPKKTGLEVLGEIKNDGGLRRIPVVILSSSGADEDILKSYDSGCNCYLTKPLNLEGFIEVVDSIREFWISRVKLPPA